MPSFERQDGGQRTAAQREAARLERERRRAQRRGEQQSPREQEALQTLERDDERSDAEAHTKPIGLEPGRTGDEAPMQEPSPGGDETQFALPAVESPPLDDGIEPPPPPSDEEARAMPPFSGGSPRSRVRGRARRSGGTHSLRARVGAVGSLAAVVVVAWLVVLLIQHIKGASKPTPSVSRPPVVKVVIPEGETRLQIAAIARKDGLTGDYMRASARSSALAPKRFGAPLRTPNLEGFLFPATYEVPVHGSVRGLVAQQLEAFQERFGGEEQRHAKALGLTSYQLLIVASMIEREALLARDRPLVAAVIYNRLRLHMPLGIDSTLRFALHDYESPLTEAQLKTPSPYNTRLNTGLPPTPISNPGMESIEAAAHPAHVAYLYYVNGADGCGDLVFSDGEAEFEAHKLAYDEALRANGGHVPACKRK